MGVDLETARFLLARRHEGARFDRCVTLGRQHYFLSHSETRGLLKDFGLSPAACPDLFAPEYPAYADSFWRTLGAQTLDSIDASDFEGASQVHDLNRPVPDSWHGAYDVVCDCGTLEHVFDFPAAIRNCMEMVACGGHFFTQTPANNYLGHGFYQFSPELFFRVLSPANGFRVERCVAVEYGLRRRWFEVTDPEAVRARVTLINAAPVILLVWARRTAIQPLFREAPQQSDYAAAWADRIKGRDAPPERVHELEADSSTARLVGRDALPRVPDSGAQDSTGRSAGSPNPSASLPLVESIKRLLLNRAPRLARALDALRTSRFNRSFSFRNRGYTRVRTDGTS